MFLRVTVHVNMKSKVNGFFLLLIIVGTILETFPDFNHREKGLVNSITLPKWDSEASNCFVQPLRGHNNPVDILEATTVVGVWS